MQEEIADRVAELLAGYMDELSIGDPMLLTTDVGPVIDVASRDMLLAHAEHITRAARWSHRCKLGPQHERGTFFAPLAVEMREKILDKRLPARKKAAAPETAAPAEELEGIFRDLTEGAVDP